MICGLVVSEIILIRASNIGIKIREFYTKERNYPYFLVRHICLLLKHFIYKINLTEQTMLHLPALYLDYLTFLYISCVDLVQNIKNENVSSWVDGLVELNIPHTFLIMTFYRGCNYT